MTQIGGSIPREKNIFTFSFSSHTSGVNSSIELECKKITHLSKTSIIVYCLRQFGLHCTHLLRGRSIWQYGENRKKRCVQPLLKGIWSGKLFSKKLFHQVRPLYISFFYPCSQMKCCDRNKCSNLESPPCRTVVLDKIHSPWFFLLQV